MRVCGKLHNQGDEEIYQMISVNVKTLPGAKLPEYESSGSAGADVRAFLNQDIVLKPGETKLVPTGLFMEIPGGYEAQIRPRSGLALKNGITILNSPGTIDSDYRGEIKIIVTNFGSENFVVSNNMRIAQIVFNKVYQGIFNVTDELNETERGHGGFGHSGT